MELKKGEIENNFVKESNLKIRIIQKFVNIEHVCVSRSNLSFRKSNKNHEILIKLTDTLRIIYYTF